jgi:DNA protecting protein DprA
MNLAPLSIERLALRLQQLPRIGVASLRRILAGMVARQLSPDEFVSLHRDTLTTAFGLNADAISALRQSKIEAELWDKLVDREVSLLIKGAPGYPRRLASLLGDAAPPLLFVKGNPASLESPGVGFCGSRKASEKGLAVARECAELLAKERLNVVSGYAHGVDLAAHCGALAAGGTTTLVLAEGILQFRIKEQLREYLNDANADSITVVSEFPPNLTWKAHNAMARNRTICGLSDALIVVESGLEGGTFEAAKTALALNEPLFCVEYAVPAESAAGNSWLVEHGAVSLRRSRSGLPNLSRVVEAAHDHRTRLSAIKTTDSPIEARITDSRRQ